MPFIRNEREREREEIFYYSTESSIGDTAVNCLRNKKGIWNSVTHALLSLGNEISRDGNRSFEGSSWNSKYKPVTKNYNDAYPFDSSYRAYDCAI